MDKLASSVGKVKPPLDSDLTNPGLLSAPVERVQMRRVSLLIHVNDCLTHDSLIDHVQSGSDSLQTRSSSLRRTRSKENANSQNITFVVDLL